MIRQRRRGNLIAVIVCAVVFLTIGLVLASVTLADLSFASSYRAGNSDELLAEAAVAQFMFEDAQLRQRTFVPPPGTTPPVDWLNRFRTQPVFPDGGARLGGTVNITFDSSQPYFSVDNTLGSTWVAGWQDRGRSTASVPPQTISLVMTIQSESRLHHYEALLECRWPYAIVAGAPVRLGGNNPPATSSYYTPTRVKGPILLLELPIQPGEIPGGAGRIAPPIPGSTAALGALSSLAGSTYDCILGFPGDRGGNTVLGRMDSLRGASMTVSANANPNKWSGRARGGYGTPEFRQRLASLFQLPDPVDYPDRLPNTVFHDVTNYGPPPPTEGLYQLDGDSLALGPGDLTDPSADPGYGSAFYFRGSLSAPAPAPGSSPFRLSLRNCRLFVDGDLEMGLGSIVGENSTLFVNGNLSMEAGGMDANDNPMVISCKRLSATAVGGYRGLMIIRESATFVDSSGPTTPGMNIQGGIVCGGAPSPTTDGSGGVSTTQSGCMLCSAAVDYDPRYLGSVNRIADLNLVRLRRLE